MSDRDTERDRYDQRATLELTEPSADQQTGEEQFLAPYRRYKSIISRDIGRERAVLELGSGSGTLTRSLTSQSSVVVALDISLQSLRLARNQTGGKLWAVCADISEIPLGNDCVDVVAAAGSLSYADPSTTDDEIRRVLKQGGSLLIVDSLNHNPFYRFNRWIHYRRGRRSRSTLLRMPTQGRIEALSVGFENVEIEYFGSFLFLYPAFSLLLGSKRSNRLVENLDNRFGKGRNAFKFVFYGTGFRGF